MEKGEQELSLLTNLRLCQALTSSSLLNKLPQVLSSPSWKSVCSVKFTLLQRRLQIQNITVGSDPTAPELKL